MSPTRARTRKSSKRAATDPAAPPPRTWSTHHLVPPHEILSEEETQKTLQTIGASAERLPKILVNDPGLRTDPKYQSYRDAHEPLAGRLVRIRRPSSTAGESIAYRILIANLGD
jgi:DNA-directed RNA polymerase subunit H